MIATRTRPTADRRRPGALRGFTLTELLVAMAIIVVIAGIAAVGIRSLARDARLASAMNTVIAGLDTARGIAIRDNRLTALVFRPRLDGNRQYVELVVAQWTGESPGVWVGVSSQGPPNQTVDRFLPVPGVAVRRLPTGMKVAGPAYRSEEDEEWQTQSHFPAPNEAAGRLLGVMFAGDGTLIFRNPVSDSLNAYVDFNGDGRQQVSDDPGDYLDYNTQVTMSGPMQAFMRWHTSPQKEAYMELVPFLAVFDDDRVREMYDPSEWTDDDDGRIQRREDYTEYIHNHADRIHFNRYTGVVMR